MLASDAVSSGSSVSLNVGNVKVLVGRGVGHLPINFFNCVELSSVLLVGAVVGPVMVRVSMGCGVGLLCLLVCLLCDLLLLLDLLEDLLEDLLLCLLWLGLLVLYLWLFVFLDLHKCEKCPMLLK